MWSPILAILIWPPKCCIATPGPTSQMPTPHGGEVDFMKRWLLGLTLWTAGGCALTPADVCRTILLPEQRSIDYRGPGQFPPAPIPPTVPPRTVSDPRP